MSKTIIESGMQFGPYPNDDCFELEKSALCLNIQPGVKMAEFALIRYQASKQPDIWLIEAKSSAPQAATKPDFDKYIDEIKQKLSNALHLVLAARLNRHPNGIAALPAGFQVLTLQNGFKLVLVINNFQDAWLPPLQDALRKALIVLCKTFGLRPTSVAVINNHMARRYKLI